MLAVIDSNNVTTSVEEKFFLNLDSLKNSPVEKAIKASAISAKNAVLSIILSGIKSKRFGPIIIPTKI